MEDAFLKLGSHNFGHLNSCVFCLLQKCQRSQGHCGFTAIKFADRFYHGFKQVFMCGTNLR